VINKHFFKILFVFIGMIVLGLLAVFLVNFFGGGDSASLLNNKVPTQVAK
jgi:hypothetical protein